jgi:uncharacterized protein
MTSVAATQFLPVAATLTMPAQSLVVSLHDVAPATWQTSRSIVEDLQRRGIRVTSLLVVPDYHHNGASMEDRSFVAWLRDLEAAGHEVVVHGYFHLRPSGKNESLTDRFVTRIYTQQEGEFFDLPYEEARRRITLAREQFEQAGLRPHGFIAPAWLLGAEAERAAQDAGMEYTTRLASVRDLRSGDTFAARSLVYSVRNEWRRAASLCWNTVLAQLVRAKTLVRVSIHPVDYQHRPIWRQVTSLLERMSEERTPTTYRDWMVDWRIRRGPIE